LLQQTHVEVYVFRRRARRHELLVLRRAPHRRVLPGVWQPVTGKKNLGERSLTAAVREVHEETGLVPARWWALKWVTLYMDAAKDAPTVLPVFAAQIGAGDDVRLSSEHDDYRFVSLDRAGPMFLWDSQRRALGAVRNEVLRRAALASHIEVTSDAERAARRLRLISRRPARPDPRR
jgi:dATP pyrophosphohydrolase